MLLDVLSIFSGIVLLYKGAEWLVGSSARIAQHFHVSRIIIGLTIIAIGTSLPELVTSIIASLQGASDVALGNVLGSNMANLGLVLAIAVIIRPIKTHIEDLYRDAPWLVFGSVLLLILAIDGEINQIDGVLLVIFGAMFYWRTATHARKERITEEGLPFHEFEIKARERFKNYALILLGIVSLVVGARLLVNGAVDIAMLLGISELLVGLTVVAIGTSLPELAAAAWSASHNETDVTLGNVIGSNIANIFVILGMVTLITPIMVSYRALQVDIPVMILFTFLTLLLIRSKGKLLRIEGVLLLTIYIVYMVWSFIGT